ncbi:16S rRNA (adenine(1518)-N(6)/adenine(1519)-N(6))-dimethyltransferase RsmA [Pedobacter antarcticus]|uniref:Ribosomal RNA small subunit methyltransferase A n=2 Tax=Pedobacter antarcticus TaxID=34086 RepID=A0A081PGQ2_9SPHI|nr:16S rRNA (adenine(1518)-N(6)/adenine(1519)-N(6))-dimethyltransferase RsmA [Pedobacter antarcticus]KEQ29875.1 16S rRNA methyltransferase [Pedobacter antarcticus 4BY]SDM14852.1 dimethyladenosine transferase [Pedobacter antarcticus]SFF14638.1 dimethyladenosine transferase [Pedobacter antarcticus]
MSLVRAKKHLGQHFLTDKKIAAKIVDGLVHTDQYKQVLEVGPGMGILSDILLEREHLETYMIDIDTESYNFLKDKYPQMGSRLINGDFLAMDLRAVFSGKFAVIGNFPYNISSQILFKILAHRDQVVEMVGMFQKEVAERCASKSGTKDYGILSVLIQAYYNIDYLFTVKPGTFNPPPKVNSGVIRLSRNEMKELPCDEKLFWAVVKSGFNQRRKTLRNALSGVVPKIKMDEHPFFDKRAEQLTVADFISLTQHVNALLNA